MTIVATGFLFFVYYFDWIIYGESKFTLIKTAEKTEFRTRSLPINKMTMCGAQDLNTRVKITFDDSYFVVDTSSDAQSPRCRPACLERDNFITESTSSKKMTHSIQIGSSNVLVERPYGKSISVPVNRLVA